MLRVRLCIFPGFFALDPQIEHCYGSRSWALSRYGALVQRLEQQGDEIGLHIHPWRWSAESQVWIEDFSDQAWVEHCVRTGLAAFEQSRGRRASSFRFGDHWMNDATLELLESLGVRVDLTIEPGMNGGQLPEPYTGSLPDYSGVPTSIYQPSTSDFRTPAGANQRGIWLMPLSTGNVFAPHIESDRRIAGTTWIIMRNGEEITGTISAKPNPVRVGRFNDPGVTTLSWSCDGERELEVRVNAPDGPLVGRTGSSGSISTGEWVTNGMEFFLQDVTGGLPLKEMNTLAKVVVSVTTESNAEGRETLTLNLGYNSLVFCRMMDQLVIREQRPYLAVVLRSDSLGKWGEGSNVRQSIAYIANHQLVKSFVFETPTEALKRLTHLGALASRRRVAD